MGLRGGEKRQKMCFPGSHVFASLDKKPAGRRWRRGRVNQWSLLLPRIGKDKQGFVAVRGGVFGTPHPPLKTQPALSLPSCILGEPSGSQALWMASCCQPPSYPIPRYFLSSLEMCWLMATLALLFCFSWLCCNCLVTPENKAWPSGSVAWGTEFRCITTA